RGNLDTRPQWQDESAAVEHIEDGDRLARFALGIERVAAEVDQEERRAYQAEDPKGQGRLGEVAEPCETAPAVSCAVLVTGVRRGGRRGGRRRIERQRGLS